MGQEASVPQHSVGDEFEQQARAPPSSSNPPLTPRGASSRASSSRKMIGAMFQRGSVMGHNGGSSYESREAARAAAEAGQIYSDTAGSQPFSYPPSTVASMPQQQAPRSPSRAVASEQHYYQQHQQQQQQQQQYYGMQQAQGVAAAAAAAMPSHPYYATNDSAAQHTYGTPQSMHPPHPVSSPNMSHPEVGVMYAPEGARPSGSSSKKSSSFRGNGRGSAIINSMRNLSLGASLRGQSLGAAAKPKEVNDWAKKWDEDEDDSEGDDEADVMMSAAMHQPLRPGMDIGHSTASPQKMPALDSPTLAAANAIMSLEPPGIHTSVSTSSPTTAQHQKGPPVARAPEVHHEHTSDLLAAPVVAQHKQEAKVDWDGGIVEPPVEEDDSKPDVQMFLPLLRVLGKGSFGKVVLVQKRVGKERGSLFAMKILRKAHLVKRRQIERTRTERKVLSVVNHPFIMKLHYAFQTTDKLYLVLDYCPGGELFFHLSRFRRFPERVARFYAAELLLAIGHLHKRGIIYRDLKPENVLLDAEGHVKLGDFGLAKVGIKHPCEGASSMCGTPEYMAPEVLSQMGHGFCVDYWGLGMLVYEMMTGLPPWYTTDRTKLFRRLKSAPLDVPTYFSSASANCVSALLERNPRRRMGVTGIRSAMEHDFFRSINWRALYGKRVEAPIRPCEGWTPPESSKEEQEIQYDSGVRMGGTMNGDELGIEKLDSNDLDAATANFDNTFTRMPVESDGHEGHGAEDVETEELHEDTFVGFTFDDGDREDPVGRQRSHPHHPHQQQQQQQHHYHQHQQQQQQLHSQQHHHHHHQQPPLHSLD